MSSSVCVKYASLRGEVLLDGERIPSLVGMTIEMSSRQLPVVRLEIAAPALDTAIDAARIEAAFTDMPREVERALLRHLLGKHGLPADPG